MTSVSDEAVLKATGKTRKEWYALLTKHKAGTLEHKKIAELLYSKYGVDGWWAQSITVDFERKIGRRGEGQRNSGKYEVTISKTVRGTLDEVIAKWMRLVVGLKSFNKVPFVSSPTTSRTPKWRYWRVDLADGTKITVTVGIKDKTKSLFAVTPSKLKDKKSLEEWRTFWKDFLKVL